MSETISLARQLLSACKEKNLMLATAESCTGGMIAAALTDILGSSAVVDRGFVTYSNEAKMDMLGVSPATLEAYGAVSRETALEMAAGALAHSRAAVSMAVTGIAGPDGGSPEKPVGLVWFGIGVAGRPAEAFRRVFPGDRARIRSGAVETALTLALEAVSGSRGTDAAARR